LFFEKSGDESRGDRGTAMDSLYTIPVV